MHLLTLLDKYAVRFIPHENGVHTIDVKFNGSHVVGSPFKVRVGEPGQAGNPALVSAYGSGLEGGTTGNILPPLLIFNQASSRDRARWQSSSLVYTVRRGTGLMYNSEAIITICYASAVFLH